MLGTNTAAAVDMIHEMSFLEKSGIFSKYSIWQYPEKNASKGQYKTHAVFSLCKKKIHFTEKNLFTKLLSVLKMTQIWA